MNRLEKALGIGALVLTLGGCDSYNSFKPEYLEGTITKESGNVVNIVGSSGALFGNESVKFGDPNYILTVKTTNGEYIINVRETNSKPLAALAEAVKVGSRVRFRTNYDIFGESQPYFSSDKIGSIPSDEVEALQK